MSILDMFNLEGSLFEEIASNIENLQSTSTTKNLAINKTVSFTGSINGVSVPAEVTLREASLTRLSVLRQKSPHGNKKEYFLVTGVLNPVKMDVNVTVDGEKMSISDLFYKFVTAKGENVDRAKFETSLSAMGMNYGGGLPLFFQQFGASEPGFTHAIEAFKNAGAVDVIGSMEKPGRIVAAYQHKTGVPVTSFELGTVDRSKSRTNQGFLNLIDAAVDTFQRVYGYRLQAHLLTQKIQGKSQKEVAEINQKIKDLNTLARQWASNWSGSQQRILVAPNGALEPQPMFDPVNAPCGRFTMVVNGTEVPCDLWSNSARANVNPAEILAVDEQPF